MQKLSFMQKLSAFVTSVVIPFVAFVLIVVASMILGGEIFGDKKAPESADEYTCTLEYRYVDDEKEICEPATFTYDAYGTFPDDIIPCIDGYHYYVVSDDDNKKYYTAWYYQPDDLDGANKNSLRTTSKPVHYETYMTVSDGIGRVAYIKNTSDRLEKRFATAPYGPKNQ